MTPPLASTDHRYAVIGAGMSGLLTAIKLREAGIENFTVYEKAARLGGTWRDNVYPGLSCDVPSHLYRYTFEPNPEWTHMFSPGAEILDYFAKVAEKYGLERFIRYETEIATAAFVDNRWRLQTAAGETDEVDFVICATGVLREPVFPKIDGLDSFEGACFHSARWDHAVSLDGARVGIIGTGSTGIQIVPAIVDQVAKVLLFQRTAQWIVPLENPAYTDQAKAEFRDRPESMDALYEEISQRWSSTFACAVVGNRKIMAKIEKACQQNLDDNVHDPDLKHRLTPDYAVACKRLIMSDAFYPAIQKSAAALVTEPILRIEAGGVRTEDGTLHELDLLVLATGFEGHRFMRPMDITGQGGITLEKTWADGNEAYRSVAVPGFPNFFMLVGPNSPIGNFSLIQISEIQLAYVMQLIDQVRSGQCRAIAPKRDATDRFNAAIKHAMKGTVWVTGCRSWYLDKNGNPAMWPWTFERFNEEMRRPDLADFELA